MSTDKKNDNIKHLDVEGKFDLREYSFEHIDTYEQIIDNLQDNINKYSKLLSGGKNEFYRNADLIREIILDSITLSGYNNRINVIILMNSVIEYIKQFIPENLTGVNNDKLTFGDYLVIIEMLYNDFVEQGELKHLIEDELKREGLSLNDSELEHYLSRREDK